MEFSGISGIHVLLKIQENRDHLVDLQKGKLFFRKISEFAKMAKDDAGRADRLEGSTHVIGKGPHNIKIESKTGEIVEAEIDDVRVGSGAVENWYCFCLYAVNPGYFHDKEIKSFRHYRKHLSIKEKVHGLGNHLLYFTDTQKLIDQVLTKIRDDGFEARVSSVKYIDVEKYSGNRISDEDSGFIKPLEFQHQNEYRIVIKNPPWLNSTHLYDVGDLSSISKIVRVEKFNSTISIGFPDDFGFLDKIEFWIKAQWFDFTQLWKREG